MPLWGPKRGRKCYVTREFSGVPNKGDKIASGHPTPAFSWAQKTVEVLCWGVPNKGDNITSGYLSPTFSKAQKKAEMLRNPCILASIQQKGPNQNWLPHPCHFGGPKEGRSAT